MKCDICSKKVEENFLNKPIGAYIKKKGKKHLVCSNCQKNLSREEILERL